MADVENLGRRVREEREKAGLSVAQLAQAAGVTKAYVVRLENHGGNPSIAVVAQLAEALGLTAADLFDRPVIRYVGDDAPVPASLHAYAEEEGLNSDEIATLASIRWRDGEVPRTSARWRYVHQSLRMSKSLDPKNDEIEESNGA